MATQKEEFSTAASAGFMPFSLYDLQEVWANLRDGNYYSAFRRLVRILDDVLNPSAGRTAVEAWTPETGEQIDDVLTEMEQWRNEMEGSLASKVVTVRADQSEPRATEFGLGEIVTIVTILLKIAQEWRKRREGRTDSRGTMAAGQSVAGVTGNDPTAFPQFGTKVAGTPAATRAPVFPSNVEVKDREEQESTQGQKTVSTNADQPKVTPTGPKTPATSTGPKTPAAPQKSQAPQQPMTGNTPKPVDPSQPTAPDAPETEQVEAENDSEEDVDDETESTETPPQPVKKVEPGKPTRVSGPTIPPRGNPPKR